VGFCTADVGLGYEWDRVGLLWGGLESYGETCFLSIVTDGSEADTAIYEGSDAPRWHRYWSSLL